jgi:glycosyltransferase involved in cell wall biosynthesis
MLENRKITVVLPAYNAGQTLKRTFDEIPHEIVDDVILIDDASNDDTVEMAQKLGIPTKYFPEASSINFQRSVVYGVGVLKTATQFRLDRLGLVHSRLFADSIENRLPQLSDRDVHCMLEPAK